MFQWCLCAISFSTICVFQRWSSQGSVCAISFFTVCVSVLVLTEAEKMCMCKLIFSCLFQWWLRCGCLCNLILDKIQTHTIFKRTPIYYDADIQSARFGGNPLCRATKWLKTTVKRLKMTRNEMRKINILYCCLSVIFWLDKGAFPESLQIVCLCHNK